MFSSFAFSPPDDAPRACLSLALGSLVDALGVCAGGEGGGEVSLAWPDARGRLLLQLCCAREEGEGGPPGASSTYAELACSACEAPPDAEGEMRHPRSSLTLPSSTLRELVDDLDWAGAPVTLQLRAQPPEVVFSARGGGGELRVALDTGGAGAHSFDCAGEGAAAAFKFKFLRFACCMPPALLGPSDGDSAGNSRLQLDPHGLLKVTHLLHLARPPAGSRGGGATATAGVGSLRPTSSTLAEPPSRAGGGPAGGGTSVVVSVTFVLLCEEEVAPQTPVEGGIGGSGA